MSVRDGVGGTGLHAVAAENTAVVVDVVDLGVALGTRDPVLFGVFGGFDIDAVRGAGGGAEETGYTLFQSIFIALQNVHATVALLELRSLERSRTVGIVLHDRRLEHFLQGDGHALGNGADVLDHGHTSVV